MKQTLLTFLLIFSSLYSYAGTSTLKSFNEDWKFYKGKQQGAESPSFDDSQWRTLDLPHDWAIEGPFSIDYNARAGGLPFHGTAWYRKEFFIKASEEGRIINLIFDAAMSNSTVWVNGKELGFRPFGYIAFKYDISEHIKYGAKNTVAVRLQPEDHSSRWYPGAGLYRNVWISSDCKAHIPHWGTFITTPTVTKALAVAQVETEIENKFPTPQNLTIQYTLYNKDNKLVAKQTEEIAIAPKSTVKAGCFLNIKNPLLWDIENPHLYTLKTKMLSRDTPIDETITTFGVRRITWDPDGFYLNGQRIRFNGVCLHHDNGPLGGAVYKRADERKLEIMKQMGVNAIRTSHNPPSPEFLDLCDKIYPMQPYALRIKTETYAPTLTT